MSRDFVLDSGTAINVRGRLMRVASPRDEADLDQPEPGSMLSELQGRFSGRADIFTFCQRLPHSAPQYKYKLEWESIAVLAYQSHKHWQEKILDDKTRNMIRKAGKKGVEIKVVDFNDFLINGIREIYDENPIRQGRLFKHYGKSFEDVKKANATHLERSVFIGATYQGELIGFIKLVYGDRTARAEQIISKLAHRDKAPTNALLDKAVILCEERGIPYLVYGIWPHKESFAQFKRNNGFKEYRLPRFYVPLSAKGKVGTLLRLHKELKDRLPPTLRDRLFSIRERWYMRKFKEGQIDKLKE